MLASRVATNNGNQPTPPSASTTAPNASAASAHQRTRPPSASAMANMPIAAPSQAPRENETSRPASSSTAKNQEPRTKNHDKIADCKPVLPFDTLRNRAVEGLQTCPERSRRIAEIGRAHV